MQEQNLIRKSGKNAQTKFALKLCEVADAVSGRCGNEEPQNLSATLLQEYNCKLIVLNS